MVKQLIITGASSKISMSLINWINNSGLIKKFKKIILISSNSYQTKKNIKFFVSKRFVFLTCRHTHYYNLNKIQFDNNSQVYIFHAASALPSNYKNHQYSEYYFSNVSKPLKLIKDLNKNYIVSLFFLSSIAVYRKTKSKILKENSPKIDISNSYGYTKLVFERKIMQYYKINAKLKKINNFTFIGLRIPVLLTKNVEHNFISEIKYSIAKNRKIKLAYPDCLYNSFCYDKDVFMIFKKIIFNKANFSKIYNIATNNPVSLRELFGKISVRDFQIIKYDKPPKLIDFFSIQKDLQVKLSSTEKAFTNYFKY